MKEFINYMTMKTKYLKKKEKLEEIFGGILYEDFDFLDEILKELGIGERQIDIENFIKICKYEKVIVKFKKISKSYQRSEFKLVSDTMFLNVVEKIENMYIKYFDKIDYNINNYYIIKNILPENSKVIFLGDFHSGLHSMIDIFDRLKLDGYMEPNSYKLKDNIYLVCTGDIADRGPYGIETLFLFFLLMLENNNDIFKVILINGNHEEKSIYQHYGMGEELLNQFEDENVKEHFEKLLYKLPVALFLKIENKKWYQFCHGGMDFLQDIGIEIKEEKINNEIKKFKHFLADNSNNFDYINFDIDFLSNGDYKIEKGFLWSDFTTEDFKDDIPIESQLYKTLKNYINYYLENKKFTNIEEENSIKNKLITNIGKKIKQNQFIKGAYVNGRNLFAKDKVNEILNKHNIQSVISGHQDQEPLGLVFKTSKIEQRLEDIGIIEKSETYNEDNLTQLYKISNMGNKGEYELNMKIVISLIVSAAVEARRLDVLCFGILDLKEDKSKLIWF